MAEMIANVPELGGFLALMKFIVLLGLVAPWLYISTWVNRDAVKLFGTATAWNAAVLAAGTLGVVLWLVTPFYVLGLLFYVILAAGALLAYVAYRNGRVDHARRVFTREHLDAVLHHRSRENLEILTKVTIYDADERPITSPEVSAENAEQVATYNLVQDLLYDMVWRRASEAGLTPAGQETRVLYLIDGVPTERPTKALADTERIAQFLKGIAGMDTDERRRPQKGKISVDLEGNRADMELTTAGTTGGQRMMFRFIQEAVRTELELIGMPPDIRDEIRKLGTVTNGLFIVSGRRGTGVTSTLYSILRLRDAFIRNVMTIETNPALDLENITQYPYDDEAKLPQIVAAMLEQELADVLMIDNCPDAETAKLIADASAKMPVLLGLQASDSFTALARWVQLCGDPAAAVRILRGVSCQMLVRQLCSDCREAYRPDPQRLAKLNLSAEKIDVFYRPGKPRSIDGQAEPEVCPTCQGSGYRGRTAVFELLQLTNDIRKLIIDGATVAQIRAACRKNRMLYLQEQTLRKVIDGTTSIQEVIRVTQQTKKR